jgi:hypothetical protein
MQEIILVPTGLKLDTSPFTTLVLEEVGDKTIIRLVKVKEEHKGTFRNLIAQLESDGRKVGVWKPVHRTKGIISRMGFSQVPDVPELWVKNE